jgi:hypothetical protein
VLASFISSNLAIEKMLLSKCTMEIETAPREDAR